MGDEQATIEMALDAFIFNEQVCSGPYCRIAPLAQPNYSYLSYDKALVRDDVMDPVELQNAFPPRNNSRYSDLGRDKPRTSRLGVYLHWVLPNLYRTGEAEAQDGLSTTNPAPNFKAVPNRWLVIRQIKPGSHEPTEAVVDEFQGWVVESDRRLDVDELGDGVDTQVDVSPYVSTDDTSHQGRYFIGIKRPIADWAEDDTANRVELTVLSSSNQLFADYQPHNGNVFSILDNFSYGTDGSQKLTAAELNYFVLGWHHDKNNDPLHTQFKSSGVSLQERLAKLRVRMRHNFSKTLLSAAVEDVGGTLCCGHIHGVKWNLNEKPAIIPAEAAAELFQTATPPIAIGTGPLDSLLAYISSHPDLDTTEQLILKIQTLLLKQNEGVDAQLEAQDMLTNRDYSQTEGGVHWYLSGENPNESVPLQPNQEQLDTLATLNAFQQKLDTLTRLLPRARWDLFAEWWKYVCDQGQDRNEELIRQRVAALTERLEELIGTSNKPEESIVDFLPNMVAGLSQALPVEPGASLRFHMQQDPTMLICGLESGWPSDHTNRSEITMTSYIRATTRVLLPNELDAMVTRLPTEYQDTATLLLEGFLGVSSNPEAAIRAYAASGKDAATIAPQFWTKQPWSPLFLEWECEYFHIPFDKFWSLDERQTDTPNKILRYGIKDGEDLSLPEHDLANDKRTVSGRVLLLPQPSFSLSAQVNQLFDSLTETELDKFLTKAEREELQKGLETFPYMSAPLSGFTEHLLTLLEGTHIKPNKREPGSDRSVPIQEAIEVAAAVDIQERQLELVDQETGATPYWNHVAGLGNTYPAFKPAAHGQFRFTKISVIDKFGQAISAIDPTPSSTGPPPIFPCISNFFACQPVAGKPNTPNTVIRTDGEESGKNQFIQIPPRLNQAARLNTGFMIGSPTQGWRPATEWENPVFGWMVVNHANYGLQIFLPDGRFYREVRLGGQSGSSVSDAWLPFGPPEDGIPETEALDRLISQLGGSAEYLTSFFQMVQQAFQSVVETPDSYSEFLSAIIGKPMALANIGWSLELAEPPLENQSLFNQVEVTETLYSYNLPLKMGDRDRFFDGLVGYYPPLQEEMIYTHFPAGGPTTAIDKSNYPTLTPFYIDPRGQQPANYVNARNEKWQVFTALVDPFVAVHGYSGILPIDDVKLPTWTVELALNRMTAFFHLGPLLVTTDAPPFNANYELKYDYNLENSQTEYPGAGVTLPSLDVSEWNWLQPYYSVDTGNVTKFMGLKLNRMPDNPPPIKELTPPFTAVEGYLQLKQSLGKRFEEDS